MNQLGNLFWITELFQLIKNIYIATKSPIFILSFHLLYKDYWDYTMLEHTPLTFHLNYKNYLSRECFFLHRAQVKKQNIKVQFQHIKWFDFLWTVQKQDSFISS